MYENFETHEDYYEYDYNDYYDEQFENEDFIVTKKLPKTILKRILSPNSMLSERQDASVSSFNPTLLGILVVISFAAAASAAAASAAASAASASAAVAAALGK